MIEESPEHANGEISGGKFVIPARDIVANLIRARKTLAVAFVVPLAISLIVAMALPTVYTTEAHLLVLPAEQYVEQSLSSDNASPPGIDSDQISKVEVEILNSRELKRAVAASIGPHAIDPKLPGPNLVGDATSGPEYERLLNVAAEELDGALVVEPQSDSSIIHVRFSNRDPKVAYDGLSVLLDAYLAYRPAIFNRDRLAFLMGKRDQAAAQLEGERSQLSAFRQAHDIVSLPTQIGLLLEEQRKLTLSAMLAEQTATERAAAGTALEASSAELPKTVTLTQDRDAESESGNSRSILLGLQLRRQELLSKYADTSHFITDLDQQIDALKGFEGNNGLRTGQNIATGENPVVAQVRGDIRNVEQERAGSEARGQEIERQAKTVQQRLSELADLELEFRRLERAVELADGQYRIFSKHYQDAVIAEAVDRRATANVRITQRSDPKRRTGSSRRLVVGAGAFLGTISAFIAAFIIPAFRDTMVTPGSAARRLRLPVLISVAASEDADAALEGSTGRIGRAHRRRRVLIIVENLPVPFDRRVWNEATTLTAAGYDVTVICPAMPPHLERYEEIEGVRIYRHWLPLQASGKRGYVLEYGAAFVMQLWLASRIFFTRGFDVIHACNPPDTIFFVALPFKLLFGRKFLFDHHDLNPELYAAKFGGKGFVAAMLGQLERWTFALADVSIATNNSYRRVAMQRGRMPGDKVFVVRSGPNLSRLLLSAPDAALKNGRAHLVAYVGTMGRQEGLHYLLEAARQIRDHYGRRDILYRLVGDGPEAPRLRLMAKAMGLENDVLFEGRVSDARLMAILATASLCVNPDEANELNDKSTMNKIMEYMVAGRAIVQFDLTEGRVSADAASDYARPNDVDDLAARIVTLLDDPERRRAMGAFGRRRVLEQLSWEHEAPKLLAAYEALFKPR